jgi:hypothetical protein
MDFMLEERYSNLDRRTGHHHSAFLLSSFVSLCELYDSNSKYTKVTSFLNTNLLNNYNNLTDTVITSVQRAPLNN